MRQVFPQVGDIAYLIHKAVVVKEVLESVHIAKVSYEQSEYEFYTDITALSKEPTFGINSLGINLFVGDST